MNLQESTQKAMDFTRRLEAALALNDLDLCREILELRGGAMAAFELSHRQAGPGEAHACREQIRELVEADRKLQEKVGSILAETARDFRTNLVSTPAKPVQGYQNGPAQACIDRKA